MSVHRETAEYKVGDHVAVRGIIRKLDGTIGDPRITVDLLDESCRWWDVSPWADRNILAEVKAERAALRAKLAAAEALLHDASDEITACIALTGGIRGGKNPEAWLVADRITAFLTPPETPQ